MAKLIFFIFLISCGTTTTTLFGDLDNESFKKRYYTEISQNKFRTDGVYYTFDSAIVYEHIMRPMNVTYREKSGIDEYYPNSKNINFDTTFKAYFIYLMWFTDNGKVFFSKHGHYYEGASPGVEVVRKEVDIDSLKHHLLKEKLDYIDKNTFTDNDIRRYYGSKGFYRVNNNDIIIKYRSRTQHGERHYENELEAKLVNDSTINYHINLSPLTGYHDFIFYKTDIQPSEYFMRLTN